MRQTAPMPTTSERSSPSVIGSAEAEKNFTSLDFRISSPSLQKENDSCCPLHSNLIVGLDIFFASPIVTHNNIINNYTPGVSPDIQYVGAPFPMISLNVVDSIAVAGTGATGWYNVTSAGAQIPTP